MHQNKVRIPSGSYLCLRVSILVEKAVLICGLGVKKCWTHTGSTHPYLSNWPGHTWPEGLQWGSFGKLRINKNVHKLLMEWRAGSFTVTLFLMYFHILIFLIVEVCLETDVKCSIFLCYWVGCPYRNEHNIFVFTTLRKVLLTSKCWWRLF